MPDVRLYLLGTLHLVVYGRPVSIDSPSISQLLAYLALYAADGRLLPRVKVASALWPDLDEARARRQLSDLVHRLRKKLEAHDPHLADVLLHADAHTLALKSIWIDVAAFREWAAGTQHAGWRAAIDLYGGDLLEDVDAPWLLGLRSTLHELYLAALAHACRALANAGSFAEALEYARRWCAADPYNEDAYQASMRLQGRLGRWAGAMRQYDQLAELLESELDAAPLPETQELARIIRAEAAAAQGGARQPLRLIGRHRERALLVELAERAQEGHGGVVLVEGERGIGKTRLLEALAESANWRGMRVVWGRAEGADGPGIAGYASLAHALRSALAGAYGAQARSVLGPGTLEQLHHLISGAAHERAAGESRNAPQLAGAVREVLRALAAVTAHAIVLDALQGASASCWELVQQAAVGLGAQRCLLVLSYRDSILQGDPAAWRALRAIEGAPHAARLRLEGLAPDECGELARSLDVRLAADESLRLHRRTAGNPLYIRELLRADAIATAPAETQRILAEELERLPAPVRDHLEAAAVLGDEWDLATWRAVSGEGMLSNLPQLVAHRTLEETPRGFCFRRGLLAEHLYAELPNDRRRDLHARAAAALHAQGADLVLVADQWAHAGQAREAAHAYGLAAEQAAQADLLADAADYYGRALALLDGVRGAARERLRIETARKALLRHSEARPAAPAFVAMLARLGTPKGKRLSDADRVTVRWTVDAGEADDTVARTAGKKALRRRRILRLLAEAAEQGAAATDRELAQALGVSERTIESDIVALREAGHHLASRGRLK